MKLNCNVFPKVIVVCSEGAFKRQQSLLSGEVLNIPTSNSSFDGLFSAGLKFFHAKHAYDYDRLALGRYEMLPLCAEEFRLVEMVPNRYITYRIGLNITFQGCANSHPWRDHAT